MSVRRIPRDRSSLRRSAGGAVPATVPAVVPARGTPAGTSAAIADRPSSRRPAGSAIAESQEIRPRAAGSRSAAAHAVGVTPREPIALLRFLMRRFVMRRFVIAIALLGGLLPAPTFAADLPGFTRSDCSSDGSVDISDPVFLLEALFGTSGLVVPCEDACDANDDGILDLADAIELLAKVFGSSSAFLEPIDCGFDPTSDALGCAAPPCLVPVLDTRVFTIETARAGLPYLGDLPAERQREITWQQNLSSGVIQEQISFVEYGLPIGVTLPGDLVLDANSGLLTGSMIPPGLHAFEVWARAEDDALSLLEVELPSFSADDAEILPGQDFTGAGFFLVGIRDEVFQFNHDLPWPYPYPLYGCTAIQPPFTSALENKSIRIYYPVTATGPRPLLVFHHGTGFTSTEYQQLFVHLASRGIICASVEDQFSFNDFEDWYCWGGHDEAAQVMVLTRSLVEGFSDDPTHPLAGRVDSRRVFYGGHSRGGSVAMVAHELFDRDVRGILMLQGTDARQDSTIGNTNRWIELPDIPVMSITAEQDTDVLYPFSERVLERFRGPSTMVTIHGGCHGYSTDASDNGCDPCTWAPVAPEVDNCRYIPRALQLDLTQHFATAFFQRYAYDDLSVEGILHGSENQGSPLVSVNYRRNLAGALVVADFDDFPLTNGGGVITSVGALLFIRGACYDWPFPVPAPIQGISNLVLIADPNGVTSVGIPTTQQGLPLDTTGRRSLFLRLKNHDINGVPDNVGFAHLNIDLALTDLSGNIANVPLDPFLPTAGFHPETFPAGTVVPLKYQRFMTLEVPLAEFTAANPSFDPAQIVDLDVTITTFGSAAVDVRLGLDDILFR